MMVDDACVLILRIALAGVNKFGTFASSITRGARANIRMAAIWRSQRSVEIAGRYIASTVQNAPDFQHAGTHDGDDQIAAKHDASDALAQRSPRRCRPRELDNLSATIAQFGDERDRATRVVACDDGFLLLAVTHRLRENIDIDLLGAASRPASRTKANHHRSPLPQHY